MLPTSRRFGVARGDDDRPVPGASRGEHGGQHAADGPHGAVDPELPGDHEPAVSALPLVSRL
jgi:hypothetical protein